MRPADVVPEAGGVRHLLYHVWPHTRDGGQAWRWNLTELKKRVGLFNGRRVVAIATSADASPPSEVRAALDGCGCEFVEVPNVPGIREVATFEALFGRVADLDGPEHVTFWAHAKGVANHTWGANSTIREWTESMYESCLDWWPDVRKALQNHATAGSYKRTIRGWGAGESSSEWHYSGSFFWVRNHDLFSQKDWRRIEQFYSGMESYPGIHFPSCQAATLVCEHPCQGMWLYERSQWQEVVNGPLGAARRRHAGPSKLNLIYHCTPLAGSCWRDNVAQLMRRADIFNGKKIVALVQGDGCVPRAEAERAFLGLRAEFVVFPRSEMRETISFVPLLERVQSTDPDEATFYAHSKGVRSDVTGEAARRWRNSLYANLLDDVPLVRRLLAHHAFVGSHRRWREGSGVTDFPPELASCAWHYSGAFFWFRNEAVFWNPRWRELPPTRFGVEAWPGTHWPMDEGACVDRDRWCMDKTHDVEDYGPDLPDLPAPVRLDLGGGPKPRPGFINVDLCEAADVRCDFGREPLPWGDDSVDEVYSSHALEHVADLHHVLHEIVRVCKLGAKVEIRVPAWHGQTAMCPGHVHTIAPEVVRHWTSDFIPYWFGGCAKRLDHEGTEHMPGEHFQTWKRLLPHATDEELLAIASGACHEIRYLFRVVPNQ